MATRKVFPVQAREIKFGLKTFVLKLYNLDCMMRKKEFGKKKLKQRFDKRALNTMLHGDL